MGTEGTRRRNRNRRLRKKKQKLPKFTISWNMFITRALIIIFTFSIVKGEIENICLYNKGVEAKALVYRRTSKGRRGVSLYEFRVSGIRYTGHDSNSKVGDSIQVVYLPKKPKINRNAEVLDQDWCIWLYRKIIE